MNQINFKSTETVLFTFPMFIFIETLLIIQLSAIKFKAKQTFCRLFSFVYFAKNYSKYIKHKEKTLTATKGEKSSEWRHKLITCHLASGFCVCVCWHCLAIQHVCRENECADDTFRDGMAQKTMKLIYGSEMHIHFKRSLLAFMCLLYSFSGSHRHPLAKTSFTIALYISFCEFIVQASELFIVQVRFRDLSIFVAPFCASLCKACYTFYAVVQS